MKRKNVLIIVENLPVPNDRRVWLESLALRDAGYNVAVISIKGRNATESHVFRDGVHIYRYPTPWPANNALGFVMEFAYCWLMTFGLSVYIAFRHGIDIIHACNPPETFWLIGWLYKLLGKKFLFDHHDLSPEMYYSRFRRTGLTYKLLVLLERLTYKTADVVVTLNETYRRVAVERAGYPHDKIYIACSGPDHHRLQPVPPDESLKQGRRYMVSYLGVLNPQDGVDTFVRVADHIVHTLGRQDILFVIMGSGDSDEMLRDLTRELQVEEDIHFTGWVQADTMRQYLSTSDVCVDTMPKNGYSDAVTQNKVLEYMSMARPIAVFDLVETRVAAQDAAVYARPDDVADLSAKIVELLADEPRRQAMGAIGRKRVETLYAWEFQKQGLLAAYGTLQQ